MNADLEVATDAPAIAPKQSRWGQILAFGFGGVLYSFALFVFGQDQRIYHAGTALMAVGVALRGLQIWEAKR